MKNTFGNNISVTLFGESHSRGIGVVIDGLPAGISVDEEFIGRMLMRRRPSGAISTARREEDEYIIQSGVFGGFTTGTPICITIPNNDTKAKDYDAFRGKARPGHADYTAHIRYSGFEDYRGGGHFSGRITAALVAAGAILIPALEEKGIYIGAHIAALAGIEDAALENSAQAIENLHKAAFPACDTEKGIMMQEAILAAGKEGDSVGGILETVIVGLPAGLGEPFFDSVESQLSHMAFSIPAVKGVEFGAGFGVANMKGSENNDELRIENGKVVTLTNNAGGINGGITNGMPVTFRCAVKPTPSIAKPQSTVDFINNENTEIVVGGRHDPCILHRAAPVMEAAAAIVIFDILCGENEAFR